MIKIAFVIDAIYTPTGGTEKQLLLLLKNLDRKKFAPTLCILRSSTWIEKEFDICPLYIVGIDSIKSPGSFLRLWSFSRFLAVGGFDVVQTHFIDGNKIGVIAAKLAGVRKIISTRRNQGHWLNAVETFTLKLLNLCVDSFIANSNSTREWAGRVEGIPPERISVIYNAIDLEPFRTLPENTRGISRAALGIPQQAFVVGIVANLRPVKCVDLFIQAARKVKDHRPDACFLVVGSCAADGIEERKLRCLTEELGLSDSVYFLGERRDVHELLPAFDVGVLSSRSESFSNSLVEYVAAGLPVVTTDVGGAREAVTNGVNGFIVSVNDSASLADAILNIAEGCLNKEDIVSKQKEAYEMFSLAKSTLSYQRIYSGTKL